MPGSRACCTTKASRSPSSSASTSGWAGHRNPFVRATQVFRSFVGTTISRLFPPKEAGLLLGLVLGDDSQLDPGLARDFHATGLGHLLVVSGENVAMVLAPVLAFAAWVGLARIVLGRRGNFANKLRTQL